MTGSALGPRRVRFGARGLAAVVLAVAVALPAGAGSAAAANPTPPAAGDSSFVLVHAARGQSFVVDTTAVPAAELRAWWIDPATGLVVDTGSVPRARSVDFYPPQTSAADAGRPWLLVVGDATQPLGGTAALLGTAFGPLTAPVAGAAPGSVLPGSTSDGPARTGRR